MRSTSVPSEAPASSDLRWASVHVLEAFLKKMQQCWSIRLTRYTFHVMLGTFQHRQFIPYWILA
jgi:hypothetical protein